MDEADWLAARFEEQRAHLRAVAYPMLGSLAEADDAGASRVVRGAPAVAGQALSFGRRYGQFARLALVNGAAGVVAAVRGRPVSVLGFTVRGGKVAEIDILADPARLRQLDLAGFDG